MCTAECYGTLSLTGGVCPRLVLQGDICQLHCHTQQSAEPVLEPGILLIFLGDIFSYLIKNCTFCILVPNILVTLLYLSSLIRYLLYFFNFFLLGCWQMCIEYTHTHVSSSKMAELYVSRSCLFVFMSWQISRFTLTAA